VSTCSMRSRPGNDCDFRIGYAPDSGFLLRDRLAGEFSEEVLRASGLFSWKQEDGLRLRAPGFRRTAISNQQSAISKSRFFARSE